jgi:hypothetical protein
MIPCSSYDSVDEEIGRALSISGEGDGEVFCSLVLSKTCGNGK